MADTISVEPTASGYASLAIMLAENVLGDVDIKNRKAATLQMTSILQTALYIGHQTALNNADVADKLGTLDKVNPEWAPAFRTLREHFE